LGKSLDLTILEVEGEDEDITEQIDESSLHMRLLKRHLVAEAKSFRDLELLIGALDSFELAGESYLSMTRYSRRHFSSCTGC
jgi:nuclear pore complex protein Nup107